MARNVFQHHDGIVYDEAGGNGKRHQGQVVQAVVREIHHTKRTDQGYRYRHTGNQHGANVAQEQEDHENHQTHGNHQGALDFTQGSADGGSLV